MTAIELGVTGIRCTGKGAKKPTSLLTTVHSVLSQCCGMAPPKLKGGPLKKVAEWEVCELAEGFAELGRHWHDGLNDGWGAQAFRRAMLFLAATQGGCTYLHHPVAPMNAPSRRHGVSHTAAEAFFGLGHGCAAAQRETATALRVRNGSAAPFLVRTAGCSGWVQVPSTLPGYSPPHPPPWTT